MLRSALLLVALCFAAQTVRAQDAELTPTETAMLSGLNAFRAQNGLPALRPLPWLMERARSHTKWMLSNGMIHSQGIAENIAMGQRSPAAVTQTWINSSGHRANMLGGHVYVGVAGYSAPNGTPYWTQVFSTSASGSPQAIEGGGSGRAITAPVKRFFRIFRR